MDHPRAEHLRKTLTGACMIGAPAMFLVSEALWPAWGSDGAELVEETVGATSRLYASTLIGLVGTALMAAAVFGLAHMLHERRPGAALLGGALTVAGLVTVAAVIGVQGFVLFEAAQPDRNAAEMGALVEALVGGSMMPLFAGNLLFMVGLAVFGVGLLRSQVAAPWMAVALIVAAVLMAIGYPAGLQAVVLAADAVLLAGLGAIGWAVLAESDEEWAHPPVFHGFGAAAA